MAWVRSPLRKAAFALSTSAWLSGVAAKASPARHKNNQLAQVKTARRLMRSLYHIFWISGAEKGADEPPLEPSRNRLLQLRERLANRVEVRQFLGRGRLLAVLDDAVFVDHECRAGTD